jgi:hypothetical protein
MKAPLLAIAVVTTIAARMEAIPLPEGAQTRWQIRGGDEIAVQLLFDVAPLAERLPGASTGRSQ